MISGVPQGSVLGPILFILYVNDLPDKVKSYCKIFADDTKLYKEINNLKDYEDLQDDIYELCRWTTKKLLFFNANKCKVLLIGNNNPRFDYEMTDKNYNKVNIKVVDHEKDLGVIFQENLKFDLHISFVVNKANIILGLIKRSHLTSLQPCKPVPAGNFRNPSNSLHPCKTVPSRLVQTLLKQPASLQHSVHLVGSDTT